MKKLKVLLMSAVIVVAVGGAVQAKKADTFCNTNPQYFKLGLLYFPAGVFGDDYTCVQAANTCTYWRPNPVMEPNTYVPCKSGCYFPIIWE